MNQCRRGRATVAVLAILAVLAADLNPRATAAECDAVVGGTEFGKQRERGKDIRVQPRVEEDGAKYLRIRLLLRAAGAAPWYLVVRDGAGRAAQVIRPADFGGSKTLWTRRIDGPQAMLDLIGAAADTAIEVTEYIAMPSSGEKTFYSLINDQAPPRPLYPNGPEAAQRLGDSVGLLTSSEDRQSWCCTGVAVADDLFLTNWHCGGLPDRDQRFFWNPDRCARTLIDFSWDGDGNAQEYQCNAVLATSRELDFALLRIAPLAGAGPVRPARLVASGSPTTNRDNLRLIHHMACLPKQLSDRCTVLRTPAPGWIADSGDVRLYHDCGSNPGSSGAPLFDRDGAVAALHHQGRDLDQQTCKPIDNFNKAIRIQAILKSLCAANPTLGARLDPTECRLSSQHP